MKCSSARRLFIASKMLNADAISTAGAVGTAAAAALLIFVLVPGRKCLCRNETAPGYKCAHKSN